MRAPTWWTRPREWGARLRDGVWGGIRRYARVGRIVDALAPLPRASPALAYAHARRRRAWIIGRRP